MKEEKTMLKIADLRKERNMSQRDLANKLSVTQASVSRWEDNQISIAGTSLRKLALFFNVSADEILGISDQIDKSNN